MYEGEGEEGEQQTDVRQTTEEIHAMSADSKKCVSQVLYMYRTTKNAWEMDILLKCFQGGGIPWGSPRSI